MYTACSVVGISPWSLYISTMPRQLLPGICYIHQIVRCTTRCSECATVAIVVQYYISTSSTRVIHVLHYVHCRQEQQYCCMMQYSSTCGGVVGICSRCIHLVSSSPTTYPQGVGHQQEAALHTRCTHVHVMQYTYYLQQDQDQQCIHVVVRQWLRY